MARESKAARSERTLEILRRLEEAYPDSRCSLDHETPFQLLAATMMSAQCTDALVNKATPRLFASYGTPERAAAASVEELEEAIRQVNFYKTKARAVQGIAAALLERHGGEVPRSMEALTALPGVGRKTANVVLGVGFGDCEGIVVDTHVKRVAARLALTKSDDPVRIEQDLLPLIPPESRVIFTHRIIDHGRAICIARRPKCEICPLQELCPTGAMVLAAAGRGKDPRPLKT